MSFSYSVYSNKYLAQFNLKNKIKPFCVQSLQELVLEFKIVTTYTRKLRVMGDMVVENKFVCFEC